MKRFLTYVFIFVLPIAAIVAGGDDVYAITCGTGSNVTFTDIGGGYCRGYIVSGTSFTVPSDWNNSLNTVEAIGGGGGGGNGVTNSTTGGGGGGGAYSSISSLTLTPGNSVAYVIGAAGGAQAAGGDTYFNGASCGVSSLCAKGGSGASGVTGGAGGLTTGVGTTQHAGGTGGTAASSATWAGAGGGGAGGPNGTIGGAGGAVASGATGAGGGGGNGGGSAGTGGSGTAGGAGGNNSGGTGGGSSPTTGNGNPGTNGGGGGGGSGSASGGGNGGAGGNGIEWDASHGSGGGGGGAGNTSGSNTSFTPGAGGSYGGGGGGGMTTGSGATNGASGAQGIIVVTYAPNNSNASFSLLGTSTNFFLRHLVFSNTSGSSTSAYGSSANFRLTSAGGEPALGISSSTNFIFRAGFLNTLKRKIQPVYDVQHYHWRNDNGNETAATSGTGGTEDTATSSVSKSKVIRLRIGIENKGGTQASYSAQQFRLEYSPINGTCAAVTTWMQVGASSTAAWATTTSTYLTNGSDTTNIAIVSGGVSDTNATFLTPNGGIRTTSNDTGSLSLPSDKWVELEYAITAQSSAVDSATYCFRVTNAGSPTLFQYDVYPQATLAAAATLSFVVDSNTENLPNITPGTPVSTTTIMTVTTNNTTGYNVSIARQTAAATMALNTDSAVKIPDKSPDWIASGATTTLLSGYATASTTQPKTLQFRVRQTGTDVGAYASTWWGTNDTTAALFAGISSTTQMIIKDSVQVPGGSTSYVQYLLDVPNTQKTGAYSGTVTYTAVANP